MKNYKDLEDKGEDATKQIRDDFYKDFDVEYWFRKISECHKSFQKYKSPKFKARAVIEIYSIYIQLVEIFCINLNAVAGTKETFLPMLFVQNNEIREFVQNIVDKKDASIEQFLERYQKKIELFLCKNDTTKADEQLRLYSVLFGEVMKDYVKDYDLLNAFKHGFRVNFKSADRNYQISIGSGQTFHLLSTTATISYYSSGRVNKRRLIYDNEVSFNPGRIFGKTLFIYAMLHNLVMVRQSIAVGGRQKYRQFVINNKDTWNESYSSFRHKMEIAEIFIKI